jgi:hypothetical protein
LFVFSVFRFSQRCSRELHTRKRKRERRKTKTPQTPRPVKRKKEEKQNARKRKGNFSPPLREGRLHVSFP